MGAALPARRAASWGDLVLFGLVLSLSACSAVVCYLYIYKVLHWWFWYFSTPKWALQGIYGARDCQFALRQLCFKECAPTRNGK